MTQAELNAYYQTKIAGKTAEQLAEEIYSISGQAVTDGVVKHFNQSVHGEDVKDDITKLTMLIRAYNDLVYGEAAEVPGNAETRISALEAMGIANTPNASGTNSSAEGWHCAATADYAHAEGYATVAAEQGAHSEGFRTESRGNSSHAEGNQTKALAYYSHTEGQETEARGLASHAEGKGTKVGDGSHYQHVQGKYNETDSSAAFIIGNGTDDEHRSNAFVVDWDGNTRIAGKLYSENGNELATKGFVETSLQEAQYPYNQWDGKLWYAYGTSITDISSVSHKGKYPTYLKNLSGMTLVDKGISGGGIGIWGGDTARVYAAITNPNDGKKNADLITLETGANDTGEGVQFGTIYDTGTSTLSGRLNDCLHFLQENTNAQIVVMPSPVFRQMDRTDAAYAEAIQRYEEWRLKIEQICKINRVHFINADNNMGYAKVNSTVDVSGKEMGKLYLDDSIHQTDLGGYVYAENIWYQLRNIPVFRKSLPEGVTING